MASPSSERAFPGAPPPDALSDAIAAVAADGALRPYNARMRALLEALGAARLGDLPLEEDGARRLTAGECLRVAGLGDLRLVDGGDQRWLVVADAAATERAVGAELAAARVRALGDLAGGIVHDLANLLLAGVGLADVLRTAVRDAGDRETLDEVQRGARQGAELGRALAGLLARRPRALAVMPLRSIVDDAVAVLRKNAARRGVGLRSAVDGEPRVRVDAAEAVQAVVHAALFALGAGATSLALCGRVEAAALAGGRARQAACLGVVAAGVDAAAAAAAAGLAEGAEGSRVPGPGGADPAGLVRASLALASAGGELLVRSAPGELTLELRWPAVGAG